MIATALQGVLQDYDDETLLACYEEVKNLTDRGKVEYVTELINYLKEALDEQEPANAPDEDNPF